MKVYRVFIEKMGASSVEDFRAGPGELFYDPENPVLRIGDGSTPGGIAIGSSGGASFEVLESNRTIGLSDSGKILFGSDQVVRVPAVADVDFSLGSMVTIVTGSEPVWVRDTDADVPAEIYLVGSDAPGVDFIVPARSIATLVKVETNTWYLAGAGVQED